MSAIAQPTASSRRFPTAIWGAVVPLPPALESGWEYLVSDCDWLRVRSPKGEEFYVTYDAGKYTIYPQRVARGDDEEFMEGVYVPAGQVYLDERAPRPLPVAEEVQPC